MPKALGGRRPRQVNSSPSNEGLFSVATDLDGLTVKMRTIVQAMFDHLGPGEEDRHIAALTWVMSDLVEDLAGVKDAAYSLHRAEGKAADPGPVRRSGKQAKAN